MRLLPPHSTGRRWERAKCSRERKLGPKTRPVWTRKHRVGMSDQHLGMMKSYGVLWSSPLQWTSVTCTVRNALWYVMLGGQFQFGTVCVNWTVKLNFWSFNFKCVVYVSMFISYLYAIALDSAPRQHESYCTCTDDSQWKCNGIAICK